MASRHSPTPPCHTLRPSPEPASREGRAISNPMLIDTALSEQLRGILAPLERHHTLRASAAPGHPLRDELFDLVRAVAATSDHIDAETLDGDGLTLDLLCDGHPTGIRFRAVPGGHEFSSLLLALLNADGKGKNLPDAATTARIRALHGPIHLVTYVSLSCTNCPDVVQALNLIALYHPGVTHDIADGALWPEETEHLGIQAVPTVTTDGQALHIGRGALGDLLGKLESAFGAETVTTAGPRRFDLIVAGGGPAAAAAAIYTARKGLDVALVTNRVGGQVNETTGIENLVSVARTTGPQLAADLRKHVEDYGVHVYDNRTIDRLDDSGETKALVTTSGERFEAPQAVIATGAAWRRLGVPGEAEYTGRGVAFCPHCDGPFYRGRDVAVVGGGNSGVEAAIDLAGICRTVTLIEFMDSLKADAVLREKLAALPNTSVRLHTETLEALGDGKRLTGLRLRDRLSGDESTLAVDGVFVQIGLTPNSAPFAGTVETNRAREIVTDRNGRTSRPGIYAAGDVTDVTYKQIVIAMGEGAKAALAAFDDRMKGR